MHSNRRRSCCRIATSLLLAGLVGTIAGCASAHREPSASAADRAAARPADPLSVAPGDTTLAGPDVGEEAAAGDTSADLRAEIVEYGPFPGEEITSSPHDVLAEVDPEIDAALDAEPTPGTFEPDYDIPMVYNDRVQFWIDFYTLRQRDAFEAGLVRSGRYLTLFREIFAEQGLPLDVIYMAHVESGYKTTAYSHAHARGIFQFIAATGRRYGLRIDYWADERLDPEKSARASAAYLKDLHAEFGDWYLALAAYNAGEGKIRRALARSGKHDFWGIARTQYIRRETKNYVPAILAAVMISKDPLRYGFELDPDPPTIYESVEIEGAVDLQVLARCAGSDLETIKALNPALRRYQTPPHTTTLVRVPPGSAERTVAELELVPLEERVLYVRHRVRSGDTLYALARNYGVSVSAIQQANRLGRRTTIRVGDELVIPTVAAGSYPASAVEEVAGSSIPGETVVSYTVRRGDTLSTIAARHRTTAVAIAATSGIGVADTLYPGQRLTVTPGVRSIEEARRIAAGDAPGGDGGLVHVVRRGETLSIIARRYGTTPTALASTNRMSVNKLLQIGERLVVRPSPTGEVARTAGSGAGTADRALPAADAVLHTVRRGDSLSRIATLYNTTVDELCALNQISKHSTLYPGTRLAVGTN